MRLLTKRIPIFRRRPRVFIAFASDNRPIAESIFRHLRNERYDVFLSDHDIKPAEDYVPRIRREIRSRDLLVFLVSGASLDPQRYPRQVELAEAKKKWPGPAGHVLSVIIDESLLEPGIKAVHDAFELHKTEAPKEIVEVE